MRRSPVRRFAAAAGAAVVAAAVVAVTASTPAVGQPGGFGDVPADAYYSVPVASLAELGVFVGTECDDGFCPGDPIDRKTMAVWTVRVLDGEDPAAITESRFDDVDADSFHAPFIERMAELEVTEGCGDGSGFCPDRSVTRAQMGRVSITRLQTAPRAPTRASQTFPQTPGTPSTWPNSPRRRSPSAAATARCSAPDATPPEPRWPRSFTAPRTAQEPISHRAPTLRCRFRR